MKTVFQLAFLTFFFLISCGGGKTVQDDPVNDAVVKPEKTPVIGWSDPDTYTVKVTGPTLENAKEKARHKILKNIVNVRVLNGSRYTDITKIVNEFDIPLKGGKVIQKRGVPEGVEIYFRIRDKGLKNKFERK